MKVSISTTYYAETDSIVELPIDDWEKVSDFYIKWDRFHYILEGEKEYRIIDLQSGSGEIVDMKRPASIYIAPVDEDGNPDFGECLYDGE